jgi:hypothetical protein
MWISAGFSKIHKVNVEFGLLNMDHKRGKGCVEGHRMQPLMWICVEPSETEQKGEYSFLKIEYENESGSSFLNVN